MPRPPELTPEQRSARTARRIRRSLRRRINKARTPEFEARLKHRVEADRPILDRLKGTPRWE